MRLLKSTSVFSGTTLPSRTNPSAQRDTLPYSPRGKVFIFFVVVVQLLSVWLSVTSGTVGLQHTRLPCPSLSPGICSNSCPLSQWCYPTISSSIFPFSSCLQSWPASASFPMSCLFVSHSQSTGASAFASVLPMDIQSWFLWGLTGLISLQSKGLSSLLQHHSSKASILRHSTFLMVQLSHLYMTTRKTIALTRWTLVSKEMSLLFNMLSRCIIAFLPECLFISLNYHQIIFFNLPQNCSCTFPKALITFISIISLQLYSFTKFL